MGISWRLARQRPIEWCISAGYLKTVFMFGGPEFVDVELLEIEDGREDYGEVAAV